MTVGPISKITFSQSGSWLAGAQITSTGLAVYIWDLITCGGRVAKKFDVAIPEVEDEEEAIVSLWWLGQCIFVATKKSKQCFSFNISNGQHTEIKIPIMDNQYLIFAGYYENFAIFCSNAGSILIYHDNIWKSHETNLESTTAAIGNEGLLFLCHAKQITAIDFVNGFKKFEYAPNSLLELSSIIQSISSSPVSGSSGISKLAVALKDKSIRIIEYSLDRHQLMIESRQSHKLHDVVDKWPWKWIGFSHDGDLVWGTFFVKGRHLVYLWDANTGALMKILEGPKEDLIAAAWNPKKSSLITCGAFGTMFRWIPDYPVKWTALIPELEEINENIVYEEREDEFDLDVKEELSRKKTENNELDMEIDVSTLESSFIPIESIPLLINP